MASDLPLFSVSDLLASLNQTLEYAYPSVEVEGEVASFKVNQQKYVFFDLKDTAGSIGCFMTVWQLRIPIEDGMKVIIRATPKLTPWGKFSMTVQSIRPSGEGSIKKSFDLLKRSLEAEGLFSLERKRPLPLIPSHIAVVSSTAAAGYADFIAILNERWGGMKVDVAHVQVQGEGAADQVIRAIQYLNTCETPPEVIVIIRGGGSADDLQIFNDELLVRAIAASRTPTLVGVGHETDETLAELVADMRAATPSNAAQIIVPDKRELRQQAWSNVRLVALRTEQAVDRQQTQIQRLLERSVSLASMKAESYTQQLETARLRLEAYNPKAILKRGYAVVRGEVAVGQVIMIERIHDTITAEVQHVES